MNSIKSMTRLIRLRQQQLEPDEKNDDEDGTITITPAQSDAEDNDDDNDDYTTILTKNNTKMNTDHRTMKISIINDVLLTTSLLFSLSSFREENRCDDDMYTPLTNAEANEEQLAEFLADFDSSFLQVGEQQRTIHTDMQGQHVTKRRRLSTTAEEEQEEEEKDFHSSSPLYFVGIDDHDNEYRKR
jgi:hypothetical protein